MHGRMIFYHSCALGFFDICSKWRAICCFIYKSKKRGDSDMAKKNYEEIADNILKVIGDTNNISFFTHCMTRLRFNLKDKSIIDAEKLNKIQGIVGYKWANDQLQVIIGQDVAKVFDIICDKTGIVKGNATNEELNDKKFEWTPKNVLLAVMDGISGCIYPMIPVLIGAGMIKVILLLLGTTGFNIVSETSDLFVIFTFVGDSAFYFMPILFGASAAKKFGANLGLGILMGAMLIHPTFINLMNEGASLSILGIPVTNASYTSTILPVIMIVWVMSHVEKFFIKIAPKTIKAIVEPLGTLLVMIPLAFCIIGPLGVILGEVLTEGLLWLYNATGVFGIGFLAALYPLLIISGMHSTLSPAMFMLIAQGQDPLVLPAMVIANLSIGAAALAVGLKTKNDNIRSISISCSVTAIVGGITEPALFGVLLKFRKALIGACVGALSGGIIAGLLKVACYSLPGSGGVFGIPSFASPQNGVLFALITFGIGMVVAFIVTWILNKKEELVD